ncbi:decaprenyl-phosphate phosphoribosyltransferase [bacterium]|nr:decaprenyl-phosphate phosphoribosyltransferase [bacterium]
MKTLLAFLENLRPRQWTKNLLLFAGVIFARKLGDEACVVRAALGAVVFCFASGIVYVYNDYVDRELDRRHPHKRTRPIASGRLPLDFAAKAGLVVLVLVLGAGWLLGPVFLGAVSFFLLWNWSYTNFFKKLPVLDVLGIGMSFVIRATAGVFVLLPVCPEVGISSWLLLCTFFLSLFLGFCKRRDELLKIKPEQGETRPALRGYTEPVLNAMIGLSFGLTTMMYALYTVWPDTVSHFGTRDLIYTLPFVLAGMGRYLYLVFLEDKGGRPHEILLTDMLLQIIVVSWITVAIMIIGI